MISVGFKNICFLTETSGDYVSGGPEITFFKILLETASLYIPLLSLLSWPSYSVHWEGLVWYLMLRYYLFPHAENNQKLSGWAKESTQYQLTTPFFVLYLEEMLDPEQSKFWPMLPKLPELTSKLHLSSLSLDPILEKHSFSACPHNTFYFYMVVSYSSNFSAW